MPEKNKIKKITCLAETQYLSLYDTEYENKKGNIKHWMIASRKHFETFSKQYLHEKRDKVDAVILAALHEESYSLVIIKQFRVPLNDYIYELPAGLIDADEDIISAAVRELKEETGLEITKVNETLGSDQAYLSAGMTEESASLVYCICHGAVTDKYLEEDEDIEVLLISQEEAERILRDNVKIDIKALVILQMFARFGSKIF